MMVAALQSLPLPVETIENLFLLEIEQREQSRQMELCGFGAADLLHLEFLLAIVQELQSQHLPVETTGNKFL